jgi:hypothetical protein
MGSGDKLLGRVPCRAVLCHVVSCSAVPCRIVSCCVVSCLAGAPYEMYRCVRRVGPKNR